jgi:PBP1b-binding outer membrane lipoprotein LpoB
MKEIIMVIVVGMFLLGGCSSFQPSKYSNYNSPHGNQIEATGAAATAAASVNTSHYGTTKNFLSPYNNSYNNSTNSLQKIVDSTINTVVSTTRSELNKEVQNAIRSVFE